MVVRIHQRIWQAYNDLNDEGRGVSYHDLLHYTFPRELYPDAFRGSNNGGPPGCARAFGTALRLMGASESYVDAGRGRIRLPSDARERYERSQS